MKTPGKPENSQIWDKKIHYQPTNTSKEKFKKYPETKENENITYQNLWNVAKLVLKEKFTVINACFNKQVSNKQPNFTPDGTIIRTNKAQS